MSVKRKVWLGLVIAWLAWLLFNVAFFVWGSPPLITLAIGTAGIISTGLAIFFLRRTMWAISPMPQAGGTVEEPKGEKFKDFEAGYHHWKFWRHKPAIAHARMHWWTKWDAPIIALIVGVGVPALAWLPVDPRTRMLIALGWMTLSTFYWPVELQEILGQINKYGKLDQKESDTQRRSMYWPYVGVAVALAAGWLPFAAVWVFMLIASWYNMFAIPGPVWYGPTDWAAELLVLVHAGFVLGYLVIRNLYPIISRYQEAYATISRLEKETRTSA